MKSKLGLVLAALVVTVAALGVLAGCDIFVSFSWAEHVPYVNVVDGSGTGIAGLTVGLYAAGATTATHVGAPDATVAGRYNFSSVTAGGEYTVKVSRPTGWTGPSYAFLDQTVTISEYAIYIGTVQSISTFVAVGGTVHDMRVKNVGIDSVALTLTDTTDSTITYSTTSATTGAFSFSYVAPGTYTLTASKASAGTTEYGFVPASQVKVTADAITDLSVVGFAWDNVLDNYTLALITVWNASFDDVDTYLSYPAGDVTTGDAPLYTSSDLYAAPSGEGAGFAPETAGVSTRSKLYFGKPSTASDSSNSWDATTHTNTLMPGTKDFDASLDGTNDTYKMQLDVDASLGSGPETIMIRTIPWTDDSTSESTDGYGISYLEDLSAGTGYYTWTGVMEYYLDAFRADYDSTTTSDYLSSGWASTVTGAYSADAVTYVFSLEYNGTTEVATTTLKGVYTVPTYTQVDQASMLRILCFKGHEGGNAWDQFVIAPDIRIAPSIKAIGGSDVPVNGVISFRGREW